MAIKVVCETISLRAVSERPLVIRSVARQQKWKRARRQVVTGAIAKKGIVMANKVADILNELRGDNTDELALQDVFDVSDNDDFDTPLGK